MPSPVLRIRGLTKRYGGFTAVEGVDLDVPEGDIYGFLGLNGAGKTTTLRMVVRLIRPTAGRVELFGEDVEAKFLDVIAKIGALVEIPAFYPWLSGRANLEVHRRLAGFPDRGRVDEVLALVGLGGRGGDPVRAYSQGMRQRLGIAQALLARPRLVILDEPTNGLDPQGIADIRGLIRRLNQSEGITFVISSHQLHEIEITCTRVGILRQGRLVREAPVRDLLGTAADAALVRAEPADRAEDLCRSFPGADRIDRAADGALRLRLPPDRLAALNAALVQGGCAVSEIAPLRQTLEELFLEETQGPSPG